MTLSVHDLSCARGGIPVLSGLNFTLSPGEALILRGPNGSGKTTLLRTLAGLTPPVAGDIDVAPETIAYAAHADGLKAQASVAENLTFWSRIFGSDGIGAAMDAFALHELADRRAGELSAGQKRRLGLARLLVSGRPIWCLDEPTVSLDEQNTIRFAHAVEEHLARGGSAILATHIDLGLTSARMLDVTPFRAMRTHDPDPFAAEVF